MTQKLNCTILINNKRGYRLNKIMDENKIAEMLQSYSIKPILYWKKK